MDSRIRTALSELSTHLPDGAVVQAPDNAALLRCTTGVSREVPAVVFASSLEEVCAVMAVVRRHAASVYPVSTGRNWGYGSANPTADGSLVLNLSRMNRILEYDAQTGLVRLEPGVTQGQLAAYLDTAGGHHMVPTTGAGPDASIVGNALERGYGITPIADHFGAVTSIEAVLADGHLYRSPLSVLGGDPGFKWHIGPYVDGLFTQGAFGVVTKATIALASRPERCEAMLFQVASEQQLIAVVERVRDCLAHLPGLVGGVNLMNARRVLAMSCPYPWDAVGSQGILSSAAVEDLRRRFDVAPWTGFGTLYGTRRTVAAARAEIRKRLGRSVSRLMFVTPDFVRGMLRVLQWTKPVGERRIPTLRALASGLDLVRGLPNETALRLAYWRHRAGMPGNGAGLDPARDGCGLHWYAPLVEMKGERVREYVDLVEHEMSNRGFEPLITLTSLSDRTFSSTVPILFERNSDGESVRAEGCHRRLLEVGCARGFVPYRVGVTSMDWLMRAAPEHFDVASRLKAALDPGGLIAPGRYTPVPGSRGPVT